MSVKITHFYWSLGTYPHHTKCGWHYWEHCRTRERHLDVFLLGWEFQLW